MPSSKAKFPFWLDGGYDREAVEACPYHPEHRWWVFQLGDVLLHPRHPEEYHVICRGCYVPRCGGIEHETDPCLLPRHHREPHRFKSGRRETVGGYSHVR